MENINLFKIGKKYKIIFKDYEKDGDKILFGFIVEKSDNFISVDHGAKSPQIINILKISSFKEINDENISEKRMLK